MSEFFHMPTAVGDDEDDSSRENDVPPPAPFESSSPVVSPPPRGPLKSSFFSLSSLSPSRRRRYVSLDNNEKAAKKKPGVREQRAHSVGSSQLMSSLNFEETDVDCTPLSSQRSCSEFLRYNSLNNKRLDFGNGQQAVVKKRGFLAYLFGRGGTSGGRGKQRQHSSSNSSNDDNDAYGDAGTNLLPPTQQLQQALPKRVQWSLDPRSRISRDDAYSEASFLVERLGGGRTSSGVHGNSLASSSSSSSSHYSRFQSTSADSTCCDNERHLLEPGCMSFFAPSSSSVKTFQRDKNSTSMFSFGYGSTTSPRDAYRNGAIMQETSLALDVLFGIRYKPKRPNMEIELKTLRRSHQPEPASNNNSHHSTSAVSSSFRGSLRSSMSGHSLGDYLNESARESTSGTQSERSSFAWELGAQGIAEAAGDSLFSLSRSLEIRSAAMIAVLSWSRRTFMGPLDDSFYEHIRIQPFATGGYLRGFLVAGFTSLFFNIYSFAMWPSAAELYGDGQARENVYESVLFVLLMCQLVLNTLQLPLRISLHLQCWESSRTVDVDMAINIIRNMVQGEAWLLNRVLGRVLDFLYLTLLVVGEAYFWLAPSTDPLRTLAVSLCATNLLAFFVRVVIATAFSLSMHNPQVLSDARRRGLSRWDLEVLPTFVFTDLREVNNVDCSICLASFDIGEMLISLPCDSKHSFHANCIRQWLERQNSCPLCQKLV